MTVRVRYAPSPTGHLHLGSLRTALYNWLFAHHNNGAFLVRIEDTDLERSKKEYTDSIMESLRWANLEPDEPLVMQSARIKDHLAVAHLLIEQKKAYRCYCTPDELRDRLGEGAAQEDSYKRYDEKCRDYVPTPSDDGKSFAIRFKIPQGRAFVEFQDLIRGPIRFERDQLDDFIIVRSDGTPMYNFVVVVDDAFMKITHVLRGEDHISNTPKQVLLYESCGYELPAFAHFSMILGADGQRLSKRHGATAVLDFKQQGFLADALCNYLVRLGWSHGDQEIFTRQELVEYFSLEHMNKKGAIFDVKKLEWVNGMYIRTHSSAELVQLIERDVDPAMRSYFTNWSSQTLEAMIALYKERVKTLKELLDELRALHERPHAYNFDIQALNSDLSIEYLTAVQAGLTKMSDHSGEAVDRLIREICKQYGAAMQQIAQPLRIALTGKTSSPSVTHVIALLSVEESVQRIEDFLEYLKRSMKQIQ